MDPNIPVAAKASAKPKAELDSPTPMADPPRPRKNNTIMPVVDQRSPSQPAAGANSPYSSLAATIRVRTSS